MVRAVIQWTDGVFTFMVRAVIHGFSYDQEGGTERTVVHQEDCIGISSTRSFLCAQSSASSFTAGLTNGFSL